MERPGEHGSRVLYVTYNGLTEPLGRRQVLPYLVGLSRRGWRYTVLSFEKAETADADACRQVEAELREARASWIRRRYHRRPSLAATAFDAVGGVIGGLAQAGDVDLVHARSTVPAAMAAAIACLKRTPWIFDVRGLVAEEYVDAGHWRRSGLPARITGASERRLLRRASGLVFLTDRIREELAGRGFDAATPAAVIPCAVDAAAFRVAEDARARTRAALGLEDSPVLAYSGSLGSWYRLPEMLDFYTAAAEVLPRLAFLVVTPSEDEARRRVAGHPRSERIRVVRARPEDVPAYLAAADAGLCFLGDLPSKAASSPTKYGEYLAAGLVVVTNPWTGDAARLAGQPSWILVDAFSREAYAQAARALRDRLADPGRREAAHALARREFSLEDALDRYEGLYRRVLETAR